jgi:hypothetical protein
MMKAQEPAKGILRTNDFGDSKWYQVVCDCGDNDCTHTIAVEAEDYGVTVTVYTQQKTNFWSKTRWHHIWQLLTKGQACFETSIVLDKQVALNYANVLQSAVSDVEEFRNQHGKNQSK